MTAVATTELDLEGHRRELTGYCYRMLGSAFDAEDAVQETMVRAWRSLDKFEGRSSLRSWLYRIATNVCMDLLGAGQRRARPMDLSATSWQPSVDSLAAQRANEAWMEPMTDDRILPPSADPAEVAAGRESIRLAFVAALQYLPPRQRAVLVLREVLRWRAAEVAELLDTTVASVNSALQRARATLAEAQGDSGDAYDPLDAAQQELLDKYVAAFEAYDMDAFVSLLREDATQSMPPYEMWLQGRDDIRAWMLGPGSKCRGSRTLRLSVNGSPGLAQWRPTPEGGFAPWAIYALDMYDGQVSNISAFLDTRLFALLGLPETPPE
ncbi:sigma-70 family RNA polymerase sigma factor [Mumia zhuanghuii]|uniref:Sigma-70 family RNA polymerase sigma factor n=1 Tax=Mumia zhuanghuii TaxID=2585211 RepID=A0A5C4MS76_9ACTN|nr:sigma-70 family RNA polymerase sigma factor [Mumia zhuanghuii]TNC43565.1 sigma-70 family RNA polymerase sigma factor [Mumia zhuanghuii]TNC48654.1 sigma-70 family RNA polymerase sigma factor [Mumia zhuanghuii]